MAIIEFIKKHFLDFRLYFKYVTSGSSAGIVQIIILYLLTEFLSVWYVFSSIIAFMLAVMVSDERGQVHVFGLEPSRKRHAIGRNMDQSPTKA